MAETPKEWSDKVTFYMNVLMCLISLYFSKQLKKGRENVSTRCSNNVLKRLGTELNIAPIRTVSLVSILLFYNKLNSKSCEVPSVTENSVTLRESECVNFPRKRNNNRIFKSIRFPNDCFSGYIKIYKTLCNAVTI